MERLTGNGLEVAGGGLLRQRTWLQGVSRLANLDGALPLKSSEGKRSSKKGRRLAGEWIQERWVAGVSSPGLLRREGKSPALSEIESVGSSLHVRKRRTEIGGRKLARAAGVLVNCRNTCSSRNLKDLAGTVKKCWNEWLPGN